MIITLGIVFGDLGTSPLYVMKAIFSGSGGHIDRDFLPGAVSCLIWTLTLQTTVTYSIFNKSPKRADTYWLLHVHICDDPHTMEYSVDHLIPGVLIRVEFRPGFKVHPRINLFFPQVIQDMENNKEVDLVSKFPSLRIHDIPADFKFVIIHRVQNYDFDFPGNEQYVMDNYSLLSRMALSDVKAYGLDSSNVMIEEVPLVSHNSSRPGLKRLTPPPNAERRNDV